jgi:purine-cytosine permease-like protein
LIIGGYGASLTKESDPAIILCSLGFIVAGLLFSLANIWTTNDSNMYAASLNLSSVIQVTRRKCVLICTVIGIILTVLHPERLSFIFTFLIFMGNTAPALAGVVYTSWFLKGRNEEQGRMWIPWAAWVLGSLASWGAGGLWSLPLGLGVASLVVWANFKTQPIRKNTVSRSVAE